MNTGDTSFLIDLTRHTVTENGVLQITGQPSPDTYSETHSYTPGYGIGCRNADWTNCSWSNQYYRTRYNYMCGVYPDVTFLNLITETICKLPSRTIQETDY